MEAKLISKLEEIGCEVWEEPDGWYVFVPENFAQKVLELLDDFDPEFKYALPASDGSYATKKLVWKPFREGEAAGNATLFIFK